MQQRITRLNNNFLAKKNTKNLQKIYKKIEKWERMNFNEKSQKIGKHPEPFLYSFNGSLFI